eukprot:m51a1_g3837 hypothetical protein (1007) ;mRNA; f:337730-344058
MQRVHSLLLVFLAARASVATCAGAAAPHALYPNSTAGGIAVLVVGQSAPFTGPHARTGTDVRAGLEAALAAANEASLVQFVLASLDDAYDDGRQASNTQALLCSGAGGTGPAFAIAGSVGSSASEAALATLLASAGSDGVPVPFVGALTSSEKLRARASVLQSSRTGVALSRAGGGDEVSAIVSFLSDRWGVLNRTSVFYQDTPFARDAFGYLANALRSNDGSTLLSSYRHAVVATQSDLSAMAVKAADLLCASGDPKAVVLLALGSMSAALVQEMARRNKTGLLYVAMSFVSAEELYTAVPHSTWEMFDAQKSLLFFTQVVPLPSDYDSNEYQKAMQKYQPRMNFTHASLEGFIAGRLVVTAASRALELNGWPLTRATFLDAIFRDIRTFKLYGSYTLGPYGDGVGTTGATQTADDWCNQGAHEIFMTQIEPLTGDLWDAISWSFKFSGCAVSGWNDTSPKSLVGYVQTDTDTSADVQLGLSAATRAQSNDGSTLVALTTTKNTDSDTALDKLIGRNCMAIAALPESGVTKSLELINKGKLLIPLIAPYSGLRSLRSPFRRGVVNLFASYYQEARTAGSLLAQKHNAVKIAVLWSSQTHYDAGKDFSTGLALCRSKNLFGVARTIEVEDRAFSDAQKDAVDYVVAKAQAGFSFIIVAGADDTWELMQAIRGASETSPIIVTSVVSPDDIWQRMYDNMNDTSEWVNVYRTSLTPQLDSLSSSNAVRQDFENWVSYIDQKFFKIDNKITVGPFLDQNSGERLCNQGIDTVYVTGWDSYSVIDKMAITREDLEAIKSEMALTHSLHHPNLLMLLGYCESKTDLLIVSEYMASGSLHEYLKKNKQNMNYYNEVAIAFIDGSMVTKICDFWRSALESAERRYILSELRGLNATPYYRDVPDDLENSELGGLEASYDLSAVRSARPPAVVVSVKPPGAGSRPSSRMASPSCLSPQSQSSALVSPVMMPSSPSSVASPPPPQLQSAAAAAAAAVAVAAAAAAVGQARSVALQ